VLNYTKFITTTIWIYVVFPFTIVSRGHIYHFIRVMQIRMVCVTANQLSHLIAYPLLERESASKISYKFMISKTAFYSAVFSSIEI
jgi:hypothetical protein